MTQQTCLYNAHLEAGAKIVDFHGWSLPIHYGSQIEEHHAVRQSAGMFDVSHMNIVDIEGDGAEQFLRHVLANDVAKLKEAGRALYTPMLNEQGGIIDDLLVYKRAQGFRLILNAATYDNDMQWLKTQAKQFTVKLIEQKHLAIIAVQGPTAREKVVACFDEAMADDLLALKPFRFLEVNDKMIARTGYTGEDGFEIILPEAQAEDFWQQLLHQAVKPCGLGARDTLRLEAGLNLYGVDMDETHTPLESNIAWTVAWTPEERVFLGREALQKQKEQADYPQLLGVILKDRGVLRSHMPVFINDKNVGKTTGGTFSPCLQKGIAFARVHAQPGDVCEVEIRGKRLQAECIRLPFVKKLK